MKPQMTEIEAIVETAFAKAVQATSEMITANPEVWYPCGFSWVKIKPARGPLVKYLKENNLGKTDSYEGGFVVYNPSKNHTQWMDAKHAGSRAFAAYLNEHGYKATACSRID